MKTCVKCGKETTQIERALTKKLVDRNAQKFMCLDCLAEYFNVSKELLLKKAEEFKNAGCSLFN